MLPMCPIALGFGAGAESHRPLGLAVVGGLLFSQLITLYITPVVYTYMESFQDFLRRHMRRRLPETAAGQDRGTMPGEAPALSLNIHE